MQSVILSALPTIVVYEDPAIITNLSGLLQKLYGYIGTILGPVAVLMIGFCALQWLFLAKDPQTSKTARNWMIGIIIAMLLYYGAGAIVTMISSLGDTL